MLFKNFKCNLKNIKGMKELSKLNNKELIEMLIFIQSKPQFIGLSFFRAILPIIIFLVAIKITSNLFQIEINLIRKNQKTIILSKMSEISERTEAIYKNTDEGEIHE